ncbi:MAG: class II fructose-bisphosphate aldolase [Clostridiales Family XIII bacterium]|jgi:fructose-bisphosphate aldolase class II|nr:class II fructose-bisphosphate aldolase [Clostridiales Family XIII bacterium]
MLVGMKEILVDAMQKKYGVAAPNVYDEFTVVACIRAAEEEKSPLILDFYEAMSDIFRFGKIAVGLAEAASVPIAINLDHGGSFEVAIKAIRAGFTSIMVDRSTLPFEENVKEVAELTRIAHSVGVSVEAELGHVGSGAQYGEDRDRGLTVPEEAVKFVELTGVDCLAVAVGTAHGVYQSAPYLDQERLIEIRRLVKVPLVLHGGSGTGDEGLKKAIGNGISKVNLFTDLSNAGHDALKAFIDGGGHSIIEDYNAGVNGFKDKLVHYIKLFGSDNKAW